MKTLTSFFAVILMISCQTTNTDNPPKFKTILLRVQGQVETVPDIAAFRVQLKCLKNSVMASKECLVDKSNELQDQLIGYGIHQEDILTSAVELDKRYRYRNRAYIFIGYESVTTMTVTTKSMESLANIYSALLENKNLNLDRLSFTHSKLDSLHKKAHLVALENANLLADELLLKLPETEKELLKIGNVAIKASNHATDNIVEESVLLNTEADYMTERVSDVVAINNGLIKVYATLFVEYQIQ
ncbi:MAG: SIMPL domain-containing protein [Eudoraea sp.]|nr:SIMPL domain-containing protein [Eudoraea sp.]